MELAKRNVAPGSGVDGIGGGGPGPHPHRTLHLDTGELMRSIQQDSSRRGFLSTSSVFSDKPYGPHLEFGWTNPWSGNHWRYPWLQPAAMEAASEIDDYAHISARRWLSDEGRPLAGRVNIGSPVSSTWHPE
jgi:hypothetical protein